MLLPPSSEIQRPTPPRPPETTEVVRAFIRGHAAFFILVSILVGQLLLLGYQITRGPHGRLIEVWAVAAFDPFERSFRGLAETLGDAWGALGASSHAQQENHQLRRQLAAARAQALQLAEEGEENAHLRALLNLQRRLPYSAIAAIVIAASPGSSSSFFIDRGRDAGVSRDLAVITPEGVVGKTIAVFRRTAQVLTITDPASGVGSMLEKDGADGVLKGLGDDLCALDYILKEEPVTRGELVVTSGLDQIYPRGLLVGRVVGVKRGAIYNKIQVKPAAHLDRLENVLVILHRPASQPSQRGGHRSDK